MDAVRAFCLSVAIMDHSEGTVDRYNVMAACGLLFVGQYDEQNTHQSTKNEEPMLAS